MTDFVLDVSKWRCGGSICTSNLVIGEGDTKLLNEEGYMCCLGQFAEQAGFVKDLLMNVNYPDMILRYTDRESLTESQKDYLDIFVVNGFMTKLSMELSQLNDAGISTYQDLVDKIESIKNLLTEHGYTLNVVNMPSGI